ncbi:MAG: choice-of-anchor D domain-containing protein [Catenulispora sp.]|nr:choice-of-anchor D domain-containing protein [Catenulispora sp.]
MFALRWGRRAVAALISAVCLAAVFTIGTAPARADDPPARLAMWVTSADFGTLPVGTPSATQTFDVINGGYTATGQVSVGLAGTNGPDFAIDSTTCRVVLASGQKCSVTVHFRPLAPGPRSATLVLSATPGGTVQVALKGVGGTAQLAAGTVPSFPGVVVGATGAEQIVTFVNTGIAPSGPVLLNFGGANAGEFTRTRNTTCGPSIPVGGHCDVAVVFSPKAAGTRTATLTATANPGGSATATLTATGLRPAQLKLTPADYDFGFVPLNKLVSTEIDITNTGQADSGPTTVTVGGPDAAFFYAASNCSQPVSPTGYCPINLYFQPATSRHYQATLTVTGTPGGTVTTTLRGASPTPAHLTISPATADFGQVPTDAPSAAQKFTVTNTGESASGQVVASLVGPNWPDYHIDGTTCGASVPGGGTCTVTAHFSPSATGNRYAGLSVTAWPGSTATANLSGSGFDRALLVVSPATTDFGSVLADHASATKTLTVTNNGHAASGPVSVALTGLNAAGFTIDSTDCGVALAPAARCSVVVHFTAGETPGTSTAALTATATPGGTATGALQATTTLPPQFTWNPAGYVYADLPVGTGSVHDFTVTNTGLHDSSLELLLENQGPGAMAFKIVGNTCGTALAVGASCTVTVEFDAPDTSFHYAVLGACPATAGICPYASLSGAGGVHSAHLTVTPPPDFGRVLAGAAGDEATITVVNDGVRYSSGPVAAKLSGANAADFTIDSTTCTTLAVGQSCQIKVHFTPGGLGDRTATLTVSAEPGGGHQVTLHGTGVDVAVSPAAFTFPDQPAGTTSATVDFVVTNHSSAPLANLTVSGTDPADFAIMGGTCLNATVPVGESCTVSVAFTGGAPGTYRSTFTVVYLADGLPRTLTFAATGNAIP